MGNDHEKRGRSVVVERKGFRDNYDDSYRRTRTEGNARRGATPDPPKASRMNDRSQGKTHRPIHKSQLFGNDPIEDKEFQELEYNINQNRIKQKKMCDQFNKIYNSNDDFNDYDLEQEFNYLEKEEPNFEPPTFGVQNNNNNVNLIDIDSDSNSNQANENYNEINDFFVNPNAKKQSNKVNNFQNKDNNDNNDIRNLQKKGSNDNKNFLNLDRNNSNSNNQSPLNINEFFSNPAFNPPSNPSPSGNPQFTNFYDYNESIKGNFKPRERNNYQPVKTQDNKPQNPQKYPQAPQPQKEINPERVQKAKEIIYNCLCKCNKNYNLALELYKSANYNKSYQEFQRAKDNYTKVYNGILKQDIKAQVPKDYLISAKKHIESKIEKINYALKKIMPLAKKQEFSIKQHFQNLDHFSNPNIQTNFSPLNAINQRQGGIPQMVTKKIPAKPMNKPSNQNPTNNAQTTPGKKKNIHDMEDDEMDAKVESEIMSTNPGVKFSDIVGMENLKQIIYEIIIMPNIRPDLFTGLRQPQRGLLLFGPPGTGKTMIAKAIASECNSTFFNISASSLTSKWVGESEKTVRSLFKIAYKKQPSIIFIDEIDSILSKRSDNDNEAAKRLKTEFLIQFDGLGSNSQAKLLVIAATNRPMDLDDALQRRLPKRVYCGPLDEKGRAAFIAKLMSTVDSYLSAQDIGYIASRTENYSNSDLKELCRDAAYEPIRELTNEQILKIPRLRPIVLNDFVKSLKRIRGTISKEILKELEEWNKQFGVI